MKRIFYILILLSICSCSDWFNVSPKSEIIHSELFQTENGYKDAMVGVYLSMTSEETYGRNLTWELMEFLGGQYYASSSTNWLNRIQSYDYSSATARSAFDDIWAKQYNTIAEINFVLKKLDSEGKDFLDPTLYNIFKGEALALRAFIHFDLQRLFGKANATDAEKAVPYVTEHTKQITEQPTVGEFFEQLHSDISEALNLLKSDSQYPFADAIRPDNYDVLVENNPFIGSSSVGYWSLGREIHMGYLPTQLLQARVYQWQNNGAEALKAAERVIEAFDILVANDEKEYAADSWPVGYSSSSYADHYFHYEQLFCINVTNLAERLELVYETHINGNSNYGRLVQKNDFINGIFDTAGEGLTDLRYLEGYSVDPSSGSNRLTTKISKTEGTYFYNIIPIMRIGEAFLIAAEASASTDKGKAIGYINFLKDKRDIESAHFLDAAITDKDLSDAIYNEYRKEFIQEGQIFYYYKRRGDKTYPGDGLTADLTDVQYIPPMPDIEIDLGQRDEFTE